MAKGPKFYFELDGLRYGARPLTIGEQATCLAKIEQLTNGSFNEWVNDPMGKFIAFNIQAAVYLNVVICQWPTGKDPVDFLNEDDADILVRYWEAYVKASDDFRPRRQSPGEGAQVAGEQPAPEMVPGSIPSFATR